jgi:hypothetical protein
MYNKSFNKQCFRRMMVKERTDMTVFGGRVSSIRKPAWHAKERKLCGVLAFCADIFAAALSTARDVFFL